MTVDTLKISRGTELTVETASEGMQLSGLRKAYGDKDLVAHIVVLLTQLRSYVKLGADSEMLVDWAEVIIKEYWYMKLEEIILALYNGARGKNYGEILLGQVLEWIDNYDVKKSNHHETDALKHKEGFQEREQTKPKHISLSESEILKLTRKT